MNPALPCALIALALSFMIHPVVDGFSHAASPRGRYRTKLLHSAETLIPVSASLGYILSAPVFGAKCGLISALAVAISALTHWLTDMITPGGVYLLGRRVRLPIFRWDDPGANAGFTILGVSLLIAGAAEIIRGFT